MAELIDNTVGQTMLADVRGYVDFLLTTLDQTKRGQPEVDEHIALIMELRQFQWELEKDLN